MAMTSKPKFNHPDGSGQKSQDRKKHAKFGQMFKVLLAVFSDYNGVVHRELLPKGRTVNKEYYLQTMRRSREAIRRKRPDLWPNNSWLLHRDNAPPAHTSLLVRDFWPKQQS